MFNAAQDVKKATEVVAELVKPVQSMLKVAPNYEGIPMNPALESEILYDLKRIYNEPSKIEFDDGAYDIRLGPFDKEYILRIKNNMIISCDKYIKRTIPFIQWARNPYEVK